MLAIFCTDDELADRARRACGEADDVEAVRAWVRFRKLFPGSERAVVVDPSPSPDLFARMHALRSRDPDVGFVLVTGRDPAALRWLSIVTVEEVVWVDELDDVLPLALRRAGAEGYFRELGADLQACSRLSPVLQEALARAACRRPPFTSVRSLAAEVDRDRRTIWHHWRDAIGDGRDLAPKGFLDWILLLRTAAAGSARTTWQRVARDLGVHTRTLRRAADRRLGVPLGELADRGFEVVCELFEREVLDALRTPTPSGNDAPDA